MAERDQVFKQKKAAEDFKFGSGVVSVFDDMVFSVTRFNRLAPVNAGEGSGRKVAALVDSKWGVYKL